MDPDLDPVFRFNADPDPAFHFNEDPDPAPHQTDGNLRPLVVDPPKLHFELPGLHCERPWLYFKTLKFPNLDFNADPDLAFFHFNAYGIRIQLSKIMRIRTRNPSRS